ncbi:MAG: TIGR00304 family membrane protein [Thermoplasmatota archaeon]
MMRRLGALAAAMIACGVALLALSVFRGEGAAGVAVFIPFLYGTGPLASLGALLLFVGLFCLFLSMLRPGDTLWRDFTEYGPEAGGAPGGSGEGERAEEGEGRGAGGGGAGEGAKAARELAAKDIWRVPGQESRRGAGEKPRAGAVIFIGPVPIVYGSDLGVARWMLALATALALALFSLLLILLLVRRL